MTTITFEEDLQIHSDTSTISVYDFLDALQKNWYLNDNSLSTQLFEEYKNDVEWKNECWRIQGSGKSEIELESELNKILWS